LFGGRGGCGEATTGKHLRTKKKTESGASIIFSKKKNTLSCGVTWVDKGTKRKGTKM